MMQVDFLEHDHMILEIEKVCQMPSTMKEKTHIEAQLFDISEQD